MLVPARLASRSRWERIVEGWIDNLHDDALTHTVRIEDPDATVEVSAVALPSPAYEIREAQGRVVAGTVDPVSVANVAKLAGVRMTAGLTRRVVDAVGDGPDAERVRDAMIEIARLSRQVAKLPRQRAERAAEGPAACWQLDTEAFVDLPDSCFAYSAAGRVLFTTREVTSHEQADFYSPWPGQRRVFERRKVARLERAGDRLTLFHSMHDNVHGFEITYEIDAATGRVLRAESATPRLPYVGICSEPQAKIGSLVGETVDAGFGRRLGGLLGGATGCAQLYDLTADLLKLLR